MKKIEEELKSLEKNGDSSNAAKEIYDILKKFSNFRENFRKEIISSRKTEALLYALFISIFPGILWAVFIGYVIAHLTNNEDLALMAMFATMGVTAILLYIHMLKDVDDDPF